jgi:hypothetical protein
MGFEASRAALRFGYTSTKLWLDEQGASLVRSLSVSDGGHDMAPKPPNVRSAPAEPWRSSIPG